MRQRADLSNLLLLLSLATVLLFTLNSCENATEICLGEACSDGDGDGDVDVDSDVDGDGAPVADERYDDREMADTATELSEGSEVHADLVPENFEMAAMLRRARWLDDTDQELQVHSGEVLINSMLERTDVIFKQTPKDFNKVDIWLDRLYMGGGDGRGITVPEDLFLDDEEGQEASWQELGGGDGRGIILPHLIVDRLGDEIWEDVEIKMSLDTIELPDDAETREQWVRELVGNLEVVQNGKVVGRGNVAATLGD